MRITLTSSEGTVASEHNAQVNVDGQTMTIVTDDHSSQSFRGDAIAMVKQGWRKRPEEQTPYVYYVELYGTRVMMGTFWTNDPVSSDAIYRCARVAQRSR